MLAFDFPSSDAFPLTVSHAPVAPWFTDQPGAYPNGAYLAVDRAVGQYINYYNLQFCA